MGTGAAGVPRLGTGAAGVPRLGTGAASVPRLGTDAYFRHPRVFVSFWAYYAVLGLSILELIRPFNYFFYFQK